MPHVTDIDLTSKDISGLSCADAIAVFLTTLGYPTGSRQKLTATSLGLTGESADKVRDVELMAVDQDNDFRVVFVKHCWITSYVWGIADDVLRDPRFVIEQADDPEYSLITRSSDGWMLFLANMQIGCPASAGAWSN